MRDKDEGREMRREGKRKEEGEEDENGSDEDICNQLDNREKRHLTDTDRVDMRYSTYNDGL